jgi:hypothetical protein
MECACSRTCNIHRDVPVRPLEERRALRDAIVEYHNLERAEADALQKVYELGAKRQNAATRAIALGWNG